MGKASRRKRERQANRLLDAQKFRIVVCAYPDASLGPTAGLLKAATLYGDEVVLHHPTATMLASIAAIGSLDHGDFLKLIAQLAPHLSAQGEGFRSALARLEAAHSPDATQLILGALSDPTSPIAAAVGALDADAGRTLAEHQAQFASLRAQFDEVIEEQLVAARVGELLPAIEAGLLTLAPIEDQDDFFQAYMDTLWAVLRNSRYYPLLDRGIAELVHAAVREGAFEPPLIGRSRGRQVGAAHEFIARLPTFPAAGMDEIIDVRDELRRPLTDFRAEMVKVARDMKSDAFDPEFLAEAEESWVERVAPALEELHELVEEKRLHRLFGQQATAGGLIGAAGGLVTGLATQDALFGAAATTVAAATSTVASALALRRKLVKEIGRRPYFFLYRTEQVLSAQVSA